MGYFSSKFNKLEVIFIDFPRNLKEIRKVKGYSQEELAEKLGLNKFTISKYEQGTREPDLNTLEKIKIALDCSYDDLLK